MPRSLAYFALFLLASQSLAQEPPRFTPLPVPGIEGAEVRAAVLDRFGALWMGTDRGVHRFDGSRTEHYLNDPLDSLSLNDDVVFRIYSGPDGAIWAATFGGAWRIDPFSGQRRRVPLVHRDGSQGTYECLGLAWEGDGTLWAFCNRSGLARMRPGEDRLSAQGLPETQGVQGGFITADGALWFTDRDALVRFDPMTGTVEAHRFRFNGRPGPQKTLLLRVLPDAHDTNALWCTTWGLGLVRFNIANQEFDRQLVHRQPISDLRNIVVGAVQRDSSAWMILIDEVLAIADARSGSLTAVTDDPEKKPQRMVGLEALGDGTVSIGREGSVAVWAPAADPMITVAPHAISKNTQIAPAADGSGYWLVRFYDDRELIHVGPDGVVMASVPLPAEDRPYEAFRVMQGSDGIVWLATTRGLLSHVPGTSTIEQVSLDRTGLLHPRPYVHAVHEQPDGVLWAALHAEGMVRWNTLEGRGERYESPLNLEGSPALVSGVGRYSENHLLVNMGSQGPVLFDIAKGVFEPIAGPGLPVELFRAATEMIADDSGRIYVLTRSHGIMRLRRTTERGWELERRWLPPDRPWFETLAFDARGRLWIKAINGLHLLDPADDILHRLDALHGFTAVRISGLAAGRDGEVLVHAGRWCRVSPQFEPVYREPRLLLRSALAGSERMGIEALLSGGIELESSSNDVHIGFGVVALNEGDAFNYGYRITRNGQQGEWADLGRERSFSLLDLRPGEYQLELRAVSPSALPVSLLLRFAVLPPWWATWWARLTFVACAVIAVVLITRRVIQARFRRVMREVEREREVERIRMRIARDIHDGIGSGLTRINILARQLGGGAGPQAERITEASAELVKELGEIVWTVDPRNDNYGSFLAYVRSTLGRQAEQLPLMLTSHLRCREEDSARIISPEVKRNVLLALKEAVNNAVKHSGAQRIDVSMVLGRDEVRLVVKDDGMGFDPEKVREGANGLVNFRKRAEALGGTSTVATGPEGTTIELRAPLVAAD